MKQSIFSLFCILLCTHSGAQTGNTFVRFLLPGKTLSDSSAAVQTKLVLFNDTLYEAGSYIPQFYPPQFANSFQLLSPYQGPSSIEIINTTMNNSYSYDFYFLHVYQKKMLNLKLDSATIKGIYSIIPRAPWYAIEGFRPIITSKGTWYKVYPRSLGYINPARAHVFYDTNMKGWYPPNINIHK